MVSLTSLWLPILASAVAVFVASSIVHMVLPLHRNDFKAVPREDEVLEALRRFNIPPGDYIAPRPASPAEMRSPAFIEKASPQQNAFVERFNGTMRDEVLNGETFRTLLEARVVIAAWVHEYNTLRPHRGLGMRTPAAFSASLSEGSE